MGYVNQVKDKTATISDIHDKRIDALAAEVGKLLKIGENGGLEAAAEAIGFDGKVELIYNYDENYYYCPSNVTTGIYRAFYEGDAKGILIAFERAHDNVDVILYGYTKSYNIVYTTSFVKGGANGKLTSKTLLPEYNSDSSKWDTTPTEDSTKPVTSGGVYSFVKPIYKHGILVNSETHNTIFSFDLYNDSPTSLKSTIKTYLEGLASDDSFTIIPVSGIFTVNNTTYSVQRIQITNDSGTFIQGFDIDNKAVTVLISLGTMWDTLFESVKDVVTKIN